MIPQILQIVNMEVTMKIFAILLFFIVTTVFFLGIYRALHISKISVGLIEKYNDKRNSPELIDEIFGIICSDILLKRILKKNHATKSDIEFLHGKLMKWGDFRKYNRYIPITSFFNVSTLDYLLKNKSDDALSLTKKMMNHFHI